MAPELPLHNACGKAVLKAAMAAFVTGRPAHILGGWSPSTPRFPKTHWEIWVSKVTTPPKMCAGLTLYTDVL